MNYRAPILKYQGVKEFYLLACSCKIMIFIPFRLEVSYYKPTKMVVVAVL